MSSFIEKEYYPEILGNMLIINSPILFSGFWAGISLFLDPGT